MSDEDVSFEEIVSGQSDRKQEKQGPHSVGDRRHGRRRATATAPRRSPFRALLPVLLVLVVVGGLGIGGVFGYRWLTSNISMEAQEKDYPGPGSGEVVIEVASGDTGTDIASTLVDEGVILTAGPFITAFSNSPDASGIEPGLYRLKLEMKSSDALALLLDPSSLAAHRVIIPEGRRASQIWPILSEATGVPVEDFEAAAADYTALGIPENAAGSLEGYLWPGRYDFAEDATAAEMITQMWERMEEQLEGLGVEPADYHKVLTIASIAEKEAADTDDYGKVVRTIENRLAGVGEAGGTPMKLQLDSTVAYFTGSEVVSTTPEERATDNPYNTYYHEGLPIGPISNPGLATLQATLDPPAGDWLYWVTVNTETGETKFAETGAEHDQNVAEWREWAASRDEEG
ncbi:endolytic transglycosylase MltG [Brachybacterium sp. DNPG3]